MIWQEQGAPVGLIRPGSYQITGTLGGFESQPLDFTCGDGPGDCAPPPLILSRFAQTTLEFSSDVIGPRSVAPNGAAVRLTGGNGEQNLLAPANSSQIELGPLSTFNTGYTVQVRAAGFQTRTVQLSALSCTDASGQNPTSGLHPGVNRCAMTLTQLGRIPLQTWAASASSPTSAVLSSVAVSAQQVASADPAAPPVGDPFSITTGSEGTGLITGSNSREGLLSGFYRITASLPGYETSTGTVQIDGATLLPGTFPVDGNGALTISLQVTPQTLPVQLISGGVAILPVGSVTVLGNDVTRTCTLTAVDAANCDPADPGTTVFGGAPKSINFSGLIPAIYTVSFRPTDDRYRPVSQQVQLFAGTPPPPVQLSLALRASGQSGTVLNSSGQPLAGAVVSLRQYSNVQEVAKDINKNPVPDVTTPTDGSFTFSLVQDGTYTVMVDAPGWNRVFSSAIFLNSQNAPVAVPVQVTTRITRSVTVTLTTTADPALLAGAQVTFQPVANTQPPGTIPPNAALSGLTVSSSSPYTVTAPQVPTGSWIARVTPAGSAFGPFDTPSFNVPDPPRPTPVMPPAGETNPPSAPVEVSRELQLGVATLTITWPEGCAAQPATGTLPIVLTRNGVDAQLSATVTPGANGSGSASVSVLLPTGPYSWVPTLTGGWTVNPVPAGTNTFTVPADGTPPVTVSRTGTLLPPQVPVETTLTIDGELESSPTITATRPGTGAAQPTGTTAGVVSFCLAPATDWTFGVRNTGVTPQLLVPNQIVPVVRGPNTVSFNGFTFTPTVALTAVAGRIPGSPSQAVALLMPLGDGNTWTSNVTIPANATSVAALPVILGGGAKTLTATPAGTIFGAATSPGVNPATTPSPTITLPYAAVTLTVTARLAGAATAGAVVTLTPAGGTTPQTTAVPAAGGDAIAIFRDIPPGPYSIAATVTATGATGTRPTETLAVGARALDVVLELPAAGGGGAGGGGAEAVALEAVALVVVALVAGDGVWPLDSPAVAARRWLAVGGGVGASAGRGGFGLGTLFCLVVAGCASPANNASPSVVDAAAQTGSGSVAASAAPEPGGSSSSVRSGSSEPPARTSVAPVPPLSSSPPPAVRPEIPSAPMLFPQADGTLAAQSGPPSSVPLNPSDGQTRDGDPYRPLVFTASNMWLSPNGGTTGFDLAVDAGQTVGAATQVRVSYDLTGDGSWDRVETYRYFATDPESGIEQYTSDVGLLSEQGQLGELIGGVVQLEIWSALGEGGTTLDLANSVVLLPFS